MTTYLASIWGLTSLLMHRWSEDNEVETTTRRVHLKKRDPRTEAEKSCHRTESGAIYIPSAAISSLLREAAGAHKQRGSRKSMKYVLPAGVMLDEEIIILNDEKGSPLTDFEVDARPVVIPATKGRIMRYRPRFNAWGCEFSLEIDDELIDPDFVHQLLTEGGKRIGLGDFRPEKGGPYGRFQVVRWGQVSGGS